MSNQIVKHSNRYLVKPRGRKIAEPEWDKHRDKILHLWLKGEGQRTTLDDIVAIMARDHGFSATASQYHNRIVKKWMIRRNITKREWLKLYHEEQRRKQSGRSTILRFNNRLISDETKEREWARYAVATESNSTGLSPLPAPFVFEDNKPNEPSPTESNLSAITTNAITAHSPEHLTTDGFLITRRAMALSDVRPFSWGVNLDWDMLIRAMKTDSQIVRSWTPDSNRLSAMFYPQTQMPVTKSWTEKTVGLQNLISSIINGGGHVMGKYSSGVFLRLANLPRQSVLAAFSSFPSETIDVLCHRIRTTVLAATKADEAEHMLSLEQDLRKDKTMSAEEIIAMFRKIDQLCNSDVAETLVRYATESSDNLDLVLELVFDCIARHVFPDRFSLILIALEAGAFPTEFCFFSVPKHDTSGLDRILSLGRTDILHWVRSGILVKAVTVTLHRPYDKVLRWALIRMVDSIQKRRIEGRWSSDDTMAINSLLSSSFRVALQGHGQEECVKAVHDCCCQLGLEPAYSQTDDQLNHEILFACHVGNHHKAIALVKSRFSCNSVPWREYTETISPELLASILSDDWRRVGILLHQEPHLRRDALDLALREGSDEVAASLAFDKEFGPRAISKILASGHLRVADRLLAFFPHTCGMVQSLQLKNDYTDLENRLYRGEAHKGCSHFLCNLPEENTSSLQVILRVISYHAMHWHDIRLLDWLHKQGLAVGALEVDNEGDQVFNIRCPSGANEFTSYKGDFDPDGLFGIALPSLLEVAIKQGEQAMLQYFLAVKPAQRESRALLCAVQCCSPLAVRELLQYEEQNNQSTKRSQYGSAALRVAIRERDYTMMRILAEVTDVHGIEKIDLEDNLSVLDWLDPLGEAVLRDDREAVQILMECGANLEAVVAFKGLEEHAPRTVNNSTLFRMTSLLVAIDLGSLAMVGFLVKCGADINRGLDLGLMRTPLQRAAEIGDFSIVQYLIQKGAAIDTAPPYGGGTALQLAAMSGYVGIATLLIENGANVNYLPARGPGRMAFEAAAEWCRPDMMYVLVQFGAQLDLEIVEVEERHITNGLLEAEADPEARCDTERRVRTQYGRAIAFAEARGEYASKQIVQNLWANYLAR